MVASEPASESGGPPHIASICRHLPRPGNDGAGAFVLNRLKALARQAPLTILQPVPYLPLLRPLPDWARAPSHETAGATIHHAPMFYLPGVLKTMDGDWLARSIRARVRQLHAAQRDLILDAHFGYPDGAGVVKVARELGVPVFVTVRGMEEEAVKDAHLRALVIDALNAATGIISVSTTLLAGLVRNGLKPAHCTVIPNAVDRATFKPGDRAAARQALGVAADAPVIISVANLVSVKRIHVLIRAFAHLLRSEQQTLQPLRSGQQPATLVLVGGEDYEPNYPAQLDQLIAELGVAAHVIKTGKIPPAKVAQWLHAADVFALCSAREGCCNAILEALAAGLPVVATPVGDNAVYVKPPFNGALVPVEDVEATARALREALGKTWDAAEISTQLPVGNWHEVAAQVLAFMRARCAALA